MNPLPLLRHHHADSVVAYLNGKAVTTARFVAHAQALAATLPEHGTVINLCDDRYYFLLSFAATLLRQQLTLLPPNRTQLTISKLASEQEGCYLLSDQPEAYPAFDCHNCQLPLGDEEAQTIPEIDGGQAAVRLYTSGSTGEATPHLKSWEMLARGAHLTATQLQIDSGTTFLATVPPQHMFGLETTVMLPLQSGCAIDNRHPLFPADIRAALHDIEEPRALITTPLQLRACASEQQPLPRCEFILSATAPLSPELAGTIEALCDTTVREIYGSTETGAIATRCTTRDELWTLIDGCKLEQQDDSWQLQASHLPQPQPIADRLSVEGRRFRLMGRGADLIKVAGKRVSLGELNHILLSLDGVRDGAFFLPQEPDDGRTVRLAAVVSTQLDSPTLLSRLREKIDPAFLPRPLLIRQQLPRNEAGKLPRHALLQLLEERDND